MALGPLAPCVMDVGWLFLFSFLHRALRALRKKIKTFTLGLYYWALGPIILLVIRGHRPLILVLIIGLRPIIMVIL